MTSRTIDAAAIIAKKIAQNLATYPKGSLSSRQVLLALPGGEQEFGQVDAALTVALWTAAGEQRSATNEELINAAQRAIGLKVKELLPTFKEFLNNDHNVGKCFPI